MRHLRRPTGRAAFMSTEMDLEISKWQVLWTLWISSRPVGNDFKEPRGNQGNRHFHMSTISTPLRGTGLH
jgi:hypothetical protein